MTRIRDFILLKSSDLSDIHQAVTDVLAQWGGDWLADGAGLSVMNREIDDVSTMALGEYATEALGVRSAHGCFGVFLLASPADWVRMSELIAGCDANMAAENPASQSRLVHSLGEAACLDFLRRLSAKSGNRHDVTNSCATRGCIDLALSETGSGAVPMHIQIQDVHMSLLLSGKVTAHWRIKALKSMPESVESLHGLQEAIAEHRLELGVCVGDVSMHVDELLSLKVNDVIVLDAPLDRPSAVNLSDEHGRKILNGFMGVSAGRKAIQVVSSH